MSRIAVAAYLMVVTAAGPWACCCTAARLSGLLRGAVAARPRSAPASSVCCRHHGGQGTPKERQAPERPRCPCREHSFGSSEALRPVAEAANQLQQRHLSSVPLGIPELLTTGLRPLHGEGALDRPGLSALPFLTSDDLLRALHNLRC